MEAVILIGIPASGKTTFYLRRFFRTHVRINLDMLRTRRREKILTLACVEAKQKFVSDNTNRTPEIRALSIAPAKAAGFEIIGYYFPVQVTEAIQRNARRPPEDRVPAPAIGGAHKALILPTYSEGFDQLYSVTTDEQGEYLIQEWHDD